ncbi:MAG TPA: hypothetical protein VMY39_08410 [Planctomycetota bacterium]|nr:hypothetical protein [Planctomycetota bacterium]
MRDDVRHRFRVALLLAVVCLAARASWGADVPHINFVFPAGAQQGKTVEVKVTGLDLADATAVHVSGDGVTGKIVALPKPPAPDPKKRPQSGKQTKETETVTVSVTARPDAKPGVRDLRLVTPGGVSNRYRFVVGQSSELVEVEPNSTREQAQPLDTLPTVVNGQLFGADRDVYRFRAKAGETIVCEVHGRRLLPFIPDAVPGWLQAALTLSDADGRELMYVDDFRQRPDPVLICRIPKDGEYLIEIKDALFRGREDFVYRLSVGTIPYVTDVYPLGAARNAAVSVRLTGANLDPDKSGLTVNVPADAPPIQTLEIIQHGVTVDPVPFGTAAFAETGETEPNDSPKAANRVTPGTVVNGRIGKPGDVDCFVFAAKEKETLVIDVWARRLDSPLDSIVVLLDAKGKELARNDDTVDEAHQTVIHHADSRVVHTFAPAGDYCVVLRDVQDKGGEAYAYRLSIAPPRPDFALRVLPDNPRIAPGETAVLKADVVRLDGFEGEVRLSVAGLPEGFTSRAAVIPAKETEVTFTLTAPSDLPQGILTPSVSGTAQIDGEPVTRPAVPAEEVQQAFSYMHRVPTRELLLAVIAPSPFRLTTDVEADKVVEIPQNGEADVVVKVTRTAQTKGQIKLGADIVPKGLTVRGATLAADKDEAVVTLRAGRLPAGLEQNVVLSGSMKIGKDTVVSYAPAVPFRVVTAPALWAVDLPPASDGIEALSGWAIDISWSRPGTVSVIRAAEGPGRLVEVVCEGVPPEPGQPDRKLALVLLQNMDLSKAKRMDLTVTKSVPGTIRISLAFSTTDWKMHETPSVAVAPAGTPVTVSFRLDGTDFKSEASKWQHTAKIPGGGRIDKMLVIVEGLPEKGTLRFDQMRFRVDAEAK